MRTALPALAALLLFSSFSCQPPDPIDQGPGDPPPAEKTLPEQVTGLQVKLAGNTIQLSWKPIAGVKGYRIYRKSEAVAPAARLFSRFRARSTGGARRAATFGRNVGETLDAKFVDRDVANGNRYTYAVAAVNATGEGPLSAPRSLLVPGGQGDDLTSWLNGPAFWDGGGGGGGGGDVTFNVPVTTTGNAGIATVTNYAAADAIEACTKVGIWPSEVRPAEGSPLALTTQTFSLTFAYNVTQESYVGAFAVIDAPTGGTEFIYDSFSLVGPGCGTKTFQFTAGLAALSGTQYIWWVPMIAGDIYSIVQYAFEGRPFIRIGSTVPAETGLLNGSTPLSVTLEYANMPTTPVVLTLGGDVTLGRASATISGSGATELELPYRTVCDVPLAALYMEAGDLGDLAIYGMAPPAGGISLSFSDTEIWVSRSTLAEGAGTSVIPQRCNGQPSGSAVTLATSRGTLTAWNWDTYDEISGQSVTATFEYGFDVIFGDAALASLGWTDFSITVTAESGGDTTSATLTVHMYDIFWNIEPPALANGWVDYPIAVTAHNLPTWTSLIAYSDFQQPEVDLPWNGMAYAGAVSFGTCGMYQVAVYDSLGQGWNELTAAVEVDSSPLPGLVPSTSWVYFEPPVQPVSVSIANACGGSASWRVVESPPWLRFASLTGTTATPLVFVLDTSATTGNWGYGTILIEPAGGGNVTWIDVDYSL